jgi:hypothetical protein
LLLLALGPGTLSGLVGWASAGAASSASRPLHASAESDGLRLTVTATRSQAPATERFTIRAFDAHVRGALGYDVAFGDGTHAGVAVPQFCLSGKGVARHARWHVSHRYAPGTYRVAVTVRANCTKALVTARLTVRRS